MRKVCGALSFTKDEIVMNSKRIFDLSLFFLILPFMIPLGLIVAIYVRSFIGSPVIFRQRRPGKHGVSFWIYKFRTMSEKKDQNGRLLPDEERMTSTGRFLRSTSLDELPSLFNVFRGEMSFVGPRPLLEEYLPHYSQEHSRRHSVAPGITGWAQVNGRNSLQWAEKFDLDIWYVENRSLIIDIKIILLTGLKVLARKNINEPGKDSVGKFTGYG